MSTQSIISRLLCEHKIAKRYTLKSHGATLHVNVHSIKHGKTKSHVELMFPDRKIHKVEWTKFHNLVKTKRLTPR